MFSNKVGRRIFPSLKQYFISLVLFLTICGCNGQVNLSTSANNAEVNLSPGQTIQINVSDPPTSGYILIQAHGYLNNVSLSSDEAFTPGLFTEGYDIGVIVRPPESVAFARNNNNVTVAVLFLVQLYDDNAPIPGGCNMELSIKTAPFLPTEFTTDLLIVEYPLGRYPLNIQPATCDRAPLQYDVYEYYIEERDFERKTAFDSIRLMSNISSIEKHGKKVTFSGSPPSKLKFANYPGTGRVVAVILRTLTDSAAYTPTLSYGCYPDSPNDEESCQVLSSVGAKLLNAGLFFAGLFLIFVGHRFYKCQVFLLGFCMTAILSYVVLERVITVGSTVAGTSSTTVGALGGALWLALWSKFRSPMAPVLLAALLLGSLVAAILAYTPLGDLALLKDDLTFWLTYLCVTLAVPLSLISFAQLTSILVTSVLGSYLFIVPIDHFVGSNLNFIVRNVLRRAVSPEFENALVDPPFQTKDLLLVIVWATLSVVGILFQVWRERGRPPFPPPPPSLQHHSSLSSPSAPLARALYTEESVEAGHPAAPTAPHDCTERSPLLLKT